MRKPDSPSSIGTASGAPAWRRRAIASRYHRCDEREAADRGKDAEGPDQDVVVELVDQDGSRRLLGAHEPVHLLHEDARAEPDQRLEGAVEEDKRNECYPADPRGGAVDAAQQQVDHHGNERDEEQHSDVNHHPARDLVMHVRVRDGLTFPGRVEQQQDRPGQWHPNREQEPGAGEAGRIHEASSGLRVSAPYACGEPGSTPASVAG